MSQKPTLPVLLLRRRAFLQLLAAGGAAATVPWLPGCGDRNLAPKAAALFFTSEERATIEALAEAMIPEDQTVGALGAGAVEYIDLFLAAFDNDDPTLYRGGPFSGRWPYQDFATGEPSDDYPRNEFEKIAPLTRLQELSFRIELYGSDAVPNGNINAPIVEPTPGLRALYRQSIVVLDDFAREAGAASFADLDAEQRLVAYSRTTVAFRTALEDHLVEGMFGDPAYGGNTDGIAWRDYQYSGDSQPLGYTFYDASTDTLHDNPERPNQTRDPLWPGNGLEPDVEGFITAVAISQGGKRFF